MGDTLEMRLMDEFFAIEKAVGDVKAVFSLQNQEESTVIDSASFEKIQFTEEEKEAMKPKAPAEGDEPPAEDGGEPKPPAWCATDFEWTMTNNKPTNLPQLFIRCKSKTGPVKSDSKKSEQYSSLSDNDAIQKSLDDMCHRVQQDGAYHYYQVVF